jgi:hypothetical protein
VQFGGKRSPVDAYVCRRGKIMLAQGSATWADNSFVDVHTTIYLWNGFANIPLPTLRGLVVSLEAVLQKHRATFAGTKNVSSKKNKDEVVEPGPADREAILMLLLGAICFELGDQAAAMQYITAVEALLNVVATETWTIAYARFLVKSSSSSIVDSLLFLPQPDMSVHG